jgi:FlaA1/EpsC-like NDP-sugar epimerase
MGIKIISTEHLEKKIISKSNRFKLTKTQIKEIYKKFKNSNILILGAAGSIGSKFVLEFLNIKFHKIYLFDKDENELTELNRAVNTKKKKTQNIQYVCGDVVNFDFKKFITENKINHVLNFSAIKHVRSEENKYSLNYMFETNCLKFLIFKYPKFLKSVFSISTDKVIKPTSMLGVSKKIMEHAMAEIKKKNPKIIVSSVRFTNVSFSKGSILESIYKKILSKTLVGVPKNVDRYFITHEEAVSLCLKSFLSQSKNYIIQPSEYFTNLPLNIKDLSIKIFQSMKVKLITKGKNKNIIFQGKISQGQKNVEDLKEDQETYLKFDTDPTIEKTKFLPVKNIDIIFSKMIKIQDKIKFINLAKKIYPKFTNDKKKIKISSVI